MEPFELLRRLAEALERLGIRYLVTGSMATIAYGEPRFTNDIDVVVDLRPDQVNAFCAAFPEAEFYCPPEFVAEAVRRKFQFNVLQPETGLKIDVMVATDSEFDRARFGRSVRVQTRPGIDDRRRRRVCLVRPSNIAGINGLRSFVTSTTLGSPSTMGPPSEPSRPLAIGRSNWLHVGGDGGLKTASVLLSVCASAIRHRLNPWSYLRDVLEQLAARPATADVNDLLPETWTKRQSPAR